MPILCALWSVVSIDAFCPIGSRCAPGDSDPRAATEVSVISRASLKKINRAIHQKNHHPGLGLRVYENLTDIGHISLALLSTVDVCISLFLDKIAQCFAVCKNLKSTRCLNLVNFS